MKKILPFVPFGSGGSFFCCNFAQIDMFLCVYCAEKYFFCKNVLHFVEIVAYK